MIKPLLLKSILLITLVVLFVFDGFYFLVVSYSGVNIVPSWAGFIRILLTDFVLLSYLFLYLRDPVDEWPLVVASTWKVILFLFSIIIVSIISGYLPFEIGFDQQNGQSEIDGLIKVPKTFFTVLFVYLISYVFIRFVGALWKEIRKFILFKKSRWTSVYFYTLLFVILLKSIFSHLNSEFNTIVSVTDWITLTGFVLLATYNSFRLSWVLYVPRKEKITTIFLLIFLIVSISIILFVELSIVKDSLTYYSIFLFEVVQLSLVYLFIFTIVSFFSLIFHLPTSEAFERKSSELSSLYSLSKLISDVFDMKELSQAVIGYSIQTTRSECGWVETIESDHERKYKVWAPQQIASDEIHTLFPDNETNIRNKLSFEREIIAYSKSELKQHTNYDIIKKKKIESILAVPLIARGELIGQLFIGKIDPNGYDKDDLNILKTFAEQAAIAIDNSRLFHKSLEKERLQQELYIAQRIQMKLLPQSNPKVPGLDIDSISYPAYEVGGDYYDFCKLSEDKLGIIVADVSGKGTSAAFYMAELKGIFQSLSQTIESPKKLLVAANTVLFGSIERKSFISLLYCVFDSKNGIVQTSRAGHCPLFIVHEDGNHTFLKSKGVGIGIIPSDKLENELDEIEVKLKQNDVLVLYSDGVVEAMNAEMEEYGYERMAEIITKNRHLTANEIQNALISDLNTFIWNGRANDDLTLVVTKWSNPV